MRIRCFAIFRIYQYSIYSVYNFTKFIILFYNFSVISFDQYRKYTIFLISFRKFWDVLSAFTCASAIVNFLFSYWGVKILSPFPSVTFLQEYFLDFKNHWTAVICKLVSSVKKYINVKHHLFVLQICFQILFVLGVYKILVYIVFLVPIFNWF